MKRKMAAVLILVMLAGALGACGRGQAASGGGQQNETSGKKMDRDAQKEARRGTSENRKGDEDGDGDGDGDGDASSHGDSSSDDSSPGTFLSTRRKSIWNTPGALNYTPVVPSVESYTVNPDLSNVDNLWQFYLSDEEKAMIAQDGFVVSGSYDKEFFEVYEGNRYDQKANFLTVDSLMHTYHLYYSHLMKNLEKGYLSESLLTLSRRMLEGSIQAYDDLKGTGWEEAAERDVAFFTVACVLLDGNTQVQPYVRDVVTEELGKITAASGIDTQSLTGNADDYSQYIVRGYYEGDEQLEKYFRAMMWYGRVHFLQEKEDLDRSSLLIAMMLSQDEKSYALWQSIYDVTAFFAGSSDDMGPDEYMEILGDVYGDDVTVDLLLAEDDQFDRFHRLTGSVGSDTGMVGAVDPGFRFMGQRFSVDANIMQRLIYDSVGKNSVGNVRGLPDVLDVPAALGSDVALAILEDTGATGYSGYTDQMTELRGAYSADNEEMWASSLYAGWLNTLRPLLDVKGTGYPPFMQNEKWALKDLECFAGSYTELKHDTVLYSKQAMAEMGDPWFEQPPDDRGYVEPEPLVYARFAALSEKTSQGLEEYGMLDPADKENLSRLTQMAEIMQSISEKELREELPTDEEFEFIRSYGGTLEHFWFDTVGKQLPDDPQSTYNFHASLVVDVATAGETVLELGTGLPSDITVAVKVDGKVKLARGSVYSFYQFEWPSNDRLTDSKWMEILESEDGIPAGLGAKPEWTKGYRYNNGWEPGWD